MKNATAMAICFAALVLSSAVRADDSGLSEISVDLKMDEMDYVSGEPIRATIEVKNLSPFPVSVGRPASVDKLFVEVFRESDMGKLDVLGDAPFVEPFRIDMNQGQTLETRLAEHFYLLEPRRFLARPVLLHRGYRYEGAYRVFAVQAGIETGKAVQLFSNREGLRREFTLLRWPRNNMDHLFVMARDSGTSSMRWQTTDVGPFMRITPPTISILPGGEVIVMHRAGMDNFVRSEFWSMPDVMELRTRQSVLDPDTAGQVRVQEEYKKSGGVKPTPRPWWKFW